MHTDTVAPECSLCSSSHCSHIQSGLILQDVQEANSFIDKSSSWDILYQVKGTAGSQASHCQLCTPQHHSYTWNNLGSSEGFIGRRRVSSSHVWPDTNELNQETLMVLLSLLRSHYTLRQPQLEGSHMLARSAGTNQRTLNCSRHSLLFTAHFKMSY